MLKKVWNTPIENKVGCTLLIWSHGLLLYIVQHDPQWERSWHWKIDAPIDFVNVDNSMHVPNHKEVHEQNFTTNEINNEFEPQLQGVGLSGVNQHFILQHYLGMFIV